MANLKTGTLIGGNLIWHQGNLEFNVVDSIIEYKGHKLYTEAHKPTPAEVGAVSKAGDTMTGNLNIKGNITLTGDPTTTNQSRTITFTAFDKEGTTDSTDFAHIRHTVNVGGHTGSVLEISAQNDIQDGIAFTTHAGSLLRHNGNAIYTVGYKPTWNDVGGNSFFTQGSDGYTRVANSKWVMAGSENTGWMPSSSGTGSSSKSYVGNSSWWFKEMWSNNYRGGNIDVSGNAYIRGTVSSNTYNALNNSRLISYASDKILRIGNSGGQETHTRIHGEGSNGHKLSVWQDNTDKWVYHEGHKPTPDEIDAVNKRAYVGEAYKELGPTQDKIGEAYKYRWYLIAEHTGKGRMDCDVELTIHGDTNYWNASGVHRIKFTRYEGNADAIGLMHVSRQCTSGNPDSMIMIVKKETGKTRVWIRSNHMWGDIYAKKIGSPKNGTDPTKIIDGTYLSDGDSQLSGAVNIENNCSFDGDSGTRKFFSVKGKLYDEGIAASDKYVQAAGDTMTGKLTISGYSSDGINGWNRNIHLSSSLNQSITGTKCGIGFHDVSSDPKGAIYIWNNCSNGTAGSYIAKFNTSGLSIEGDGKLFSHGVDSRAAYNMLASSSSNTLISMPNVPINGVAYINWKAGNNIISFRRKHDSSENTTIVNVHGNLHEMSQRVYSPNNKPTWADVGGTDYLYKEESSKYIRTKSGYYNMCAADRGWFPSASGSNSTSKDYLGNSGWWFKESWVNSYRGGSIDITGGIVLRHSSPTISMVDTDNKTAFLHNNSDRFYVLRSAGNAGTTWDNGPNNRHPMILDLNSGDATFSRSIKGYYTESNSYSAQYGTLAPFYNEYTTSSSSAYFPMVKQKGTHSTGAEDWVTSIGQLVNSSGVVGTTLQMIKSNGTARYWEFKTNGEFRTPGTIYENGQRVYSPNNKPNPTDIGAVGGKNFVVNKGSTCWFRLCTVTLWQGATTCKITITGGTGYNVDVTSQLGTQTIIMRSGNGSPKGINLVSIVDGGLLPIVADMGYINTSGDVYDIYVKVNNYASAGLIWTVEHSSDVNRYFTLRNDTETAPTVKPSGLIQGSKVQFITNYTTRNKPTPAEVGAVSKAGDTMTGKLYINYPDASIVIKGSEQSGKEGKIKFLESLGDGVGTQSVQLRYNSFGAIQGLHIESPETTENAYLKVEGDIFANNTNKVYHEGYKPTPDAIGAIASSGEFRTARVTHSNHYCQAVLILCPKSVATTGEGSGRYTVAGRLTALRGAGGSALVSVDAEISVASAYNSTVASSMAYTNGRGGYLCTITYGGKKYIGWNITNSTNAQDDEITFIGRVENVDGNFFKVIRYKGNGNSSGTGTVVNTEIANSLTRLTTGSISASGELKEGDVRVYSPNYKPTAADVGAVALSGDTIKNGKLLVSDLNGAYVGTPKITLAVGDSDTGFKAVSDGQTEYWSNNTRRYNMNNVLSDGSQHGTVKLTNWFRSIGNTGWHSETYGGGIYMKDSDWIRIWGGKKFHIENSSSDSIYTIGGIKSDNKIVGKGTGNDYHNGAFEAIGNGTANTVYPTYGFHQPGLYASSIQCRGAQDIRFYAQGGTSYATITARRAFFTDSIAQVTVENNDKRYTTLSGCSYQNNVFNVKHTHVHNRNGNMYYPSFGSKTQTTTGYHQHLSIGHKRTSGGWDYCYFAAGGADGYPTKEWLFKVDNGDFVSPGNVTAYSDIRIKKDIKVIDNALDKVMQIHGVTYSRTDIENGKRHAGVIAQEVEKVLPEVVTETENGDIKDFKTVAYGNMVGLLIEAIKELKAEIETLKNA